MNVTKCDLCKKEIKGGAVIAGRSFFGNQKAELCAKCGAPVLKFLIKHKIIKKEKTNIEKTK